MHALSLGEIMLVKAIFDKILVYPSGPKMYSKIKEKLFLDIGTFKSHCKNICYINEQKRKKEANMFHYWGNPNKVLRHHRQKKILLKHFFL